MQDRWVSYIYRYSDGKMCENAGYIKVIRTSRGNVDEARIDIGLKLYKQLLCRCRIYMIYGGRELVLLEELLVPPEEKDVISLRKTLSWRDFLRSGLVPGDYDGVFFAVDDGDSLMSLWSDKDINISELSVADNSPKVGLIPVPEYLKVEEDNQEHTDLHDLELDRTPDIEDITGVEYDKEAFTEECLDEFQTINPEKHSDNAIEHMMETGIKLPIFIDSPFSECVKIVPQDIGRLPMVNWKLGQNSFLTHGYYRYKYIMLGKVKRKNQAIYVIGVPGVYTNKEKYLANMFGFTLFMPVKKADTKTGCFGYWVWEVMRQ